MNRRRLNQGDKKKAVFFDRDGTINSDEGHYYIYRKEDFIFNPGVIEGMKLLKEAGFLIFVVTNQGGVAKGIYSKSDVEEVNGYMLEQLRENGVSVEKVYYCPHHESIKTCICRKPSPYFVNVAVDDFNLDKKNCYFIGDSSKDVKCAEAAEIKAIKITKNQDLLPVINNILTTKRIIPIRKEIVVDDNF